MEFLKMEEGFCPGKHSWPELKGTDGQKAVKIIEEENAFVRAVIVYEKCPVTADFRCFRVRVFVNCAGIVVGVPVVG